MTLQMKPQRQQTHEQYCGHIKIQINIRIKWTLTRSYVLKYINFNMEPALWGRK
jgi:hypothetical protein